MHKKSKMKQLTIPPSLNHALMIIIAKELKELDFLAL